MRGKKLKRLRKIWGGLLLQNRLGKNPPSFRQWRKMLERAGVDL